MSDARYLPDETIDPEGAWTLYAKWVETHPYLICPACRTSPSDYNETGGIVGCDTWTRYTWVCPGCAEPVTVTVGVPPDDCEMHRKVAMRELGAAPDGCENPIEADDTMLMCGECRACLDYIAEYWYRVAHDIGKEMERREQEPEPSGDEPTYAGIIGLTARLRHMSDGDDACSRAADVIGRLWRQIELLEQRKGGE